MPRRFPIGPLVAAVGGVVLLVSLFLDWYADFSAWTAFEVLDLVLAALAIAALFSLLRALGLDRRGLVGAELLLPVGAVAFVIVLSQLLNHPPAAIGEENEVGIWLAFGASLLMLGGALLAFAHISLAVDVEPRDDTAPTRPVDPGERPPGTGDPRL